MCTLPNYSQDNPPTRPMACGSDDTEIAPYRHKISSAKWFRDEYEDSANATSSGIEDRDDDRPSTYQDARPRY